MNEHSYSKSVKNSLQKAGFFSWKINDNFAPGVPDFFLEGIHKDVWLEVKYLAKPPKRSSTLIDLTNPKRFLSHNQQSWLKRREAIRGDTCVLLGSPAGHWLFFENTWQLPFAWGELEQSALTRTELSKKLIEHLNSAHP